MAYLTKFHGMFVVSDDEQYTVRGNHVIEVNSNGAVVCRYYDEEGNAEDDPQEIDLFGVHVGQSQKITEANLTGLIKRTVGKNSLLISNSAINYIKNLVD